MVAALGSRGDVGVYGAAYQPIEYLFLASAIVVQVIFPLIARARHQDQLAFVRMYRRGTDLVLATVGPVAALLAISARPLVHVAYTRRVPRFGGPDDAALVRSRVHGDQCLAGSRAPGR